MTIAYAAVHRTLRYRNENTKLYVATLEDGSRFFARHPPDLYDRQACPTPMREVLPGSYVNIRYLVEHGINWMEAVQIVREPSQPSPFDPIAG